MKIKNRGTDTIPVPGCAVVKINSVKKDDENGSGRESCSLLLFRVV